MRPHQPHAYQVFFSCEEWICVPARLRSSQNRKLVSSTDGRGINSVKRMHAVIRVYALKNTAYWLVYLHRKLMFAFYRWRKLLFRLILLNKYVYERNTKQRVMGLTQQQIKVDNIYMYTYQLVSDCANTFLS